jgi:MinD superfamily P-loop ATPase
MRIAVASGKGGTGKTTVATSLAISLETGSSNGPLFLDCDVEAPNAHLFLQPLFQERIEVGIPVPQVDASLCNQCGRCAEVCQYHAIAVLGRKVLIFTQLCHGCGSCGLICPEEAITEKLVVTGVLERGQASAGFPFAHGVMNVGEPMAVPVIRQLKRWALPLPGQTVILDVPPGTSCPVVESLRGAEYLLLVTEPTPFGLHDLKLAVELANELQIPAGVIVNRDGCDTFPALEEFCAFEGLPILLSIPFERQIAEGIARGQTLVEIHPEYMEIFRQLATRMFAECK